MIKKLTSEEISQLAKDIHAGRVFTNYHIRGHLREMVGSVFMPIVLGAFQDVSEEDKSNIGMIYEYMDRAGPLSVNGMPTFFSLQLCSKEDTYLVWEKVKKIEEILSAV